MKQYLAYICGHFPPLGYEEFYAVLEAENVEYKILLEADQIIIFECKSDPVTALSRCAFLHSILLLTNIGEINKSELIFHEQFSSVNVETDKSYCVRVQKIGEKTISLETPDLETKLGSYIYLSNETKDPKVDLRDPDYLFTAILLRETFFLGLELWSMDRKKYGQREPSKREFFRPGSMRTDIARAIVNLSRIKANELFFDPFSGSGGFLLEAAEIGAHVLGSDLDFDAVEGSARNLRQYKRFGAFAIQGDSRQIPLKKVDAIATDPPYSSQSSTHGENLENLIYEFLTESRKILKPGKYLVFSTPASLNPEKIVEKTDFKIITMMDTRVHKSLTRRILVLK